ncbi:hypothetical protein AB0280_01745 [Pseudarthrobacter sp902506025]|uniref:Uncharacterized protein n=1 Tax=Pseudarthrobacter defluvii TaxID=410837 RepID=A0ABT9UGD9_9MICC|nr:hypothetical protein [Pseudarthrobacter defluvii]MDQ0118698.1 hypothetical protein [Pseudarthrobacter defluvii]
MPSDLETYLFPLVTNDACPAGTFEPTKVHTVAVSLVDAVQTGDTADVVNSWASFKLV